MPIRKANKQEREMAEEVWEFLPKPMYRQDPSGGQAFEGPGVIKLRELGDLGARALSNIRKGYDCKLSTFQKLRVIHAKLAPAVPQLPVFVENKPPASLERAVVELSDELDSIRALQNNHGRTLLEVKGMLEKLMKALGETV